MPVYAADTDHEMRWIDQEGAGTAEGLHMEIGVLAEEYRISLGYRISLTQEGGGTNSLHLCDLNILFTCAMLFIYYPLYIHRWCAQINVGLLESSRVSRGFVMALLLGRIRVLSFFF